jgi:hypothetical protein
MKTPGFAAEASLYRTARQYLAVATSSPRRGVTPGLLPRNGGNGNGCLADCADACSDLTGPAARACAANCRRTCSSGGGGGGGGTGSGSCYDPNGKVASCCVARAFACTAACAVGSGGWGLALCEALCAADFIGCKLCKQWPCYLLAG